MVDVDTIGWGWTAIFINNRYVVLVDRVTSLGYHTYQWRLHGAGEFESGETGGIFSTATARLHVHVTGYPGEPEYLQLSDTHETAYEQTAEHTVLAVEQSAENAWFISVLYPCSLSENTPVIENLEVSGGVGVTIQLPGSDERTVVAVHNDSSYLQIEQKNSVNMEKMHTALLPGYPNPFNAQVTIPFVLESRSAVTLRIYNISGQEVFSHSEKMTSGKHEIRFHDPELSSGVYIVRFDAVTENNTKTFNGKLLLIK